MSKTLPISLIVASVLAACSQTHTPRTTSTTHNDISAYTRCFQAAEAEHHGILPKSEAIYLQKEFMCIQEDMAHQRQKVGATLQWRKEGLNQEDADTRFTQAMYAQVPITQQYATRMQSLVIRNNEVNQVREKLAISLQDFATYTAASFAVLADKSDADHHEKLVQDVEQKGEIAQKSQEIALTAYRELLQKYHLTE
ncbi:hypothetical protein [Wielerella bovis]|uniref:hypothetical protein n=1 Tax=Wielerella bovis TaxID=2917790 RepID=UPI002018A946|nr:hypothetical protein [Wielerella bovis]MCG7657564.1 hypothetical protein [Wielerella bovis]MCG7659785.1 hypothetical protein [Wielerella bovis]